MKKLFIAWLSLLLYGCTTFPQAVKPTTGGQPSPTEIYIVSHGWHTGIIAPAHDVNTVLPQLKKRFAQETQWYEIGWGDKGFYQSQEITTALTLQAMFWSSGAVMHIVAFSGKPERYFAGSEIKSLLLHTNQRNSLMRYLGRSFARDAEGNLIPLKQGIYGDSQFYAANGRYGILNTCNKWTAKGLESGGTDYKSFVKTHGRKRNESDYGSQNVSEQILLSLENKKSALRRFFSGGNLFAARDAEALVEALNTTTGINNTLLTSEERVAFAAHVQVQVVTHGRVGFDNITARTGCSNFYVIRVNTFFHGEPQCKAASLFQP